MPHDNRLKASLCRIIRQEVKKMNEAKNNRTKIQSKRFVNVTTNTNKLKVANNAFQRKNAFTRQPKSKKEDMII